MTTPPSPSRAFDSSAAARPPGRFAHIATIVVRLLLGLPLVVFGLNGFLDFIPPPPTPLADGAAAFSKALIDTGYMMPLIGATQLLVGVLLVFNRFVPLALVLFAPFIVNAVAFHLALERTGLVPSLVFLALHLFLAWRYRTAYAALLQARHAAG